MGREQKTIKETTQTTKEIETLRKQEIEKKTSKKDSSKGNAKNTN